jgi:hypothetical protein
VFSFSAVDTVALGLDRNTQYRAIIHADKRLELTRVRQVDDAEKGVVLGSYKDRGAATAAVKKMAFEVEPRSWS